MHPAVAQVIAGANAFLGLILAVLEIQCWRRIRRRPWGWIHLLLVVVGFYWFALYTWIMVIPAELYNASLMMQYVRPALTITLMAMALSSLKAARNEGGCT